METQEKIQIYSKVTKTKDKNYKRHILWQKADITSCVGSASQPFEVAGTTPTMSNNTAKLKDEEFTCEFETTF